MKYKHIETSEECSKVCKTLLKKCTVIAVDTEFFRKEDKWSLSTIQISSDIGNFIFDCDFSNQNLKILLENPNILKIFHGSTQDLIVLLPIKVFPIFDTQVAMMFLSRDQIFSYKTIVEKFLKIKIAKECKTTDWSIRPLTTQQIEYAIEDVLYLYRIYLILKHKLTQKGKFDWAYRAMNEEKEKISEQIELSYDQTQILVLLKYLLRKRSIEHSINEQLIADKHDLLCLILKRDTKVLHGWRYEILGKEIEGFLNGSLALKIKDDVFIFE